MKVFTAIERLTRDSRALELQNSVLSLVVGLVFVADTFATSSLYQRFPDTYRYMEWLPAYGWGLIYAGAGAVHFFSLIYDNHRIRKAILLTKCGLWMFLSACTLLADTFAFAGWIYGAFAYSAAAAFLRLKSKDGRQNVASDSFGT